ncbi:MAG: electron transport complex subunit E [Oscillospiraceae bacterium]|jgi:electron transport complex protein RnfE|nr:electron transport complex subunit E [Oscillospiraceae bacterium]
MADTKTKLLPELTKGFIQENPVLRLVLGTCPTLAISTTLTGAVGMGVAATIVLIITNALISALRKVIPDKVRIPCYITIIASMVTVVQYLVKAYLPDIDKALGIYLPLITVNCIILGRADGYANRHTVAASVFDGVGMGIGFTAALSAMAILREVLGSGSIGGLAIPGISANPILIFILPPGGFFVYGLVMAVCNKLAVRKGKPAAALDCANCPGCGETGCPENDRQGGSVC